MSVARGIASGLLAAAACLGGQAGEPHPCPIVPRPKEYQDSGTVTELRTPGVAAIVVGARASEAEQYAAETLQAQLQRRFQRKLPIHAEPDVPTTARQWLLLGQPETCDRVKELCQAQGIALSSTSPGPDGYLLRHLTDGSRQIILVGGSNARGVIYGQHALFDLCRSEGPRVVIPVASVRDWPSIAWRGRPHSVLQQHLVPGALDAYLRSRINFTDVRDDPEVQPTIIFPARKASMGFPAGRPLDVPLVQRMINQSHRRGLFVYGTVSCGVKQSQIGDVLKTYQELIELGVDGLWISFDDVGAGDDAPRLIRRVLELGAQHGMTGRKIAITPPPQEYQSIDMPFNRQAASTWGLADAQWMFTRVPCATDASTAKRIGINGLPGWWHNLVEIRGGFLHNGGVICPLRANGKPGYVDIQPLRMGWHSPDYETLRDAPQHTDCVLLWGVVGGWPEEYQIGALGLWAWDPLAHDWERTRAGIYRYVYGPSQADAARAFDDKLAALKDLFEVPPWRFWPATNWPCRLKQVESRPQGLALLDELERIVAGLQQQAPSETAIDSNRLESVYLEPMRATLDYARRMALLDYPEYTLADFERTVPDLLDAERAEEARRLVDTSRTTVQRQLPQIRHSLADLKGIDLYAAAWEERTSNIEHWKRQARQRQEERAQRLQQLLHGDVAALFPYRERVEGDALERLLAPCSQPPAGKPLIELRAADWLQQPAWCSGAFCLGEFDWRQSSLIALAYPRHTPSRKGEGAEVRAELTVPPGAGRLALEAFITDTRLDGRYPGHRYVQLWVNDQLLWEEDIAPSREGREWVSVALTEAATPGSRLALRFRVVDKRGVGDHLSVVFLGPVRLRAAE